MIGSSSLSASQLIRETQGILLPLSGRDAVSTTSERPESDRLESEPPASERPESERGITRVEFDVDLPASRNRPDPDEGEVRTDEGGRRTDGGRIGGDRTGLLVLVTVAITSATDLDAAVRAHSGAAALVLGPGAHSHLAEVPAGSSGPLLLERSPHITWSEVLVHLRQLLDGASDALAWPDVDDLGSLAAVIADSTGASITIEDPASRVLAYSNLGDDIDEIRKATILGGAVPEWRIAHLEENGFLPAIRASHDVVERPATDGEPARSVIALRSDGELLGTIWAAYTDAVDPASMREVLRDAAKAALPVMLRTLRRSPFEKRLRAEALASILGGASDIGPAATLLSLPFAGTYIPLAFAEVSAGTEALLRFHLRAAFADAVLARDVGDGVGLAVLLQSDEPEDEVAVRDRLVDVLERTMPRAEELLIGVGASVGRLDDVRAAWSEARYVLDVLVAGRAAADDGTAAEDLDPFLDGDHVVAVIAADVPAELVGLEIADALADVDPRISAPARILAAHDARNQGDLLRTLTVYFDAVGNVAEAARRLHVHSNSLRHRLGRIEELTGLTPLRRADRRWLELSVLIAERQGR